MNTYDDHGQFQLLSRYARTRLPERLHTQLSLDAARRQMTISRLMRLIIDAHYSGRPLPREPQNGPSYAVARELNRIGVNLNQLARHANAYQALPALELRPLIQRLETALRRL